MGELARTSSLKRNRASFFNSSMDLCSTQLTDVTCFPSCQTIFVGLTDALQNILLKVLLSLVAAHTFCDIMTLSHKLLY